MIKLRFLNYEISKEQTLENKFRVTLDLVFENKDIENQV